MSGITPTYPWSPSSELALFQAMIANKPAGELEKFNTAPYTFRALIITCLGINKHFAMAVVSERLSGQFGSEMTSDVIWGKLRTMFDLSAVDDREEAIPFTLEEREFALPRKDFISLINDKQKEINRVNSKYLQR